MSAATPGKPNIIVILADDFGVGDIHAHYPDNKIRTPGFDQLVREGMSFTDAHSPSAVCTPSRYGLLTGRYAWRTRLQEWVLACFEPPLIAADRVTLPGFLQTQGYRTACIGKWHLGWEWPGPQPNQMSEVQHALRSASWDFGQRIRSGPTERGFDTYFGTDVPNYPPFTFIENDRVAVPPTDTYKFDPSEGVVLPRGFAGSPMAPGWRFENILPELTQRAVRQVRDFAREGRPFFLYFALTSPHEPVSPTAEFRGRSGIAPIADFIMETDQAVDRVVQAVDEAGLAGNTIVIFTSDNGHSSYTGWEQLIAAGHQPSGPYRGYKGDIWEGGHRVPLIVRWPGRIAAGSRHDQIVCLTDLFATVADAIGTDLPATYAEDSFSFLPAALGQAAKSEQRTTLVNHSNHGEFAYRDGPWKLVFRNRVPQIAKSRGQPRVAELYNLETDCAEKHDVAAQNPEIVARLERELAQVIARGASRADRTGRNDTPVRHDRTQTARWGPAEQ